MSKSYLTSSITMLTGVRKKDYILFNYIPNLGEVHYYHNNINCELDFNLFQIDVNKKCDQLGIGEYIFTTSINHNKISEHFDFLTIIKLIGE